MVGLPVGPTTKLNQLAGNLKIFQIYDVLFRGENSHM